MDRAERVGGAAAQAYRIGELAAATQLTPDTLRYYERLGLLVKPRRSPGGFRLYGPDAVAQVRFVKQARRSGSSSVRFANWPVPTGRVDSRNAVKSSPSCVPGSASWIRVSPSYAG